MKIAIIGTGNLGLSIAKGLVINNTYTTLYLSKRNIDVLSSWKEYKNVFITQDNKEAVQNSDIIIFAVQPNQFDLILKEVKSLLTDKHVLISTITGYTIDRMESIIGNQHPIIRSMPNTAISVGKSMTCLCSNDTGKKKLPIAEAIYNGLGTSLVIEEQHMQAATVLCASGIAFWMRLIRATTQGGVQLGFDADVALKMSMQTAMGAASLLIETGSHPEEEIDRVTTPRGCTITGLNEMEHQGLSSSLIKGLNASFNKINDIAKQ
ncbi:MAG: pyrroline-5-carboxylate reductase [Flavobacteriaceae bacterium]|jgi:pyrroline-5-carboxylate reductase|nr:pyrroline-5-carboxylate reductase [Flavobacteriaceae bacterium]MBT4313489.1 pyrroline-5-carboxylate reductase [Flavobacteriaceae bacterium]MBT5090942.1 pyrroline-5-carboxylate reductase [Flavobacteriaceae bacterium]MBT5283626.1 pyrroline-5-carboxylate reductase [Flavobacteriaceae bacterium]MBT5446989.1 pyrroline-5-carboxylate reductase [Flavobacteriaceae bacterium]|tara:strand:- start:4070 stop:4864 length:795 start_codon:yes stop_codon:yes gene_type:complete